MDFFVVYLTGFFVFLIAVPLCVSKDGTRYDNVDIAFGTLLFSLFWPLFLIVFMIYKFVACIKWYRRNVVGLREKIKENDKAYSCAIDLLSKIPADSFSYEHVLTTEQIGIDCPKGRLRLACKDGGNEWTVSIRNIEFNFTKNRFFFSDELRFFEKTMDNVRRLNQEKEIKKFKEFQEELLNIIKR